MERNGCAAVPYQVVYRRRHQDGRGDREAQVRPELPRRGRRGHRDDGLRHLLDEGGSGRGQRAVERSAVRARHDLGAVHGQQVKGAYDVGRGSGEFLSHDSFEANGDNEATYLVSKVG